MREDRKRNKSNSVYIFLMILFLICFIITLILLINQHNEYSSLKKKYDSKIGNITEYSTDIDENIQSTTKTESELKENIKIEALGITASGDFVIKVLNNNDIDVNIESVSTIFKDENDTFIEKAESYNMFFCVAANSEVVVYDWGYDKDFSQYPNYEFTFSFSNLKDSYLYDNFEIVSNDTGSQVSVQIINNNTNNIENMEVNVVYYKNDSVVGIETGSTFDSISSNGGSAYINVDYPEDSNYKEVSFDSYKVYLIQAGIE